MKRRRDGFTLIELIAAMAVLGVAMATVTLALHVLYRVDTRVRDSLAWQANLDRFTVAFRRDAHEAEEAQLPPAKGPAKNPDELLLRMPQSTSISYVLGTRSIDRMVRQGDKLLSRESFRLPAASAQWNVTTNSGVTKVTLRLLPLGPATDGLHQRREESVSAVTRLFRVQAGSKVGLSAPVPGGTGGLSTRVRNCAISNHAPSVPRPLFERDSCNTTTRDIVLRSQSGLENELCSRDVRQRHTGGQATRATQYAASAERYRENLGTTRGTCVRYADRTTEQSSLRKKTQLAFC